MGVQFLSSFYLLFAPIPPKNGDPVTAIPCDSRMALVGVHKLSTNSGSWWVSINSGPRLRNHS
jgi:hypothetical protein